MFKRLFTKPKRPVLDIPPSSADIVVEVVAALGVLLLFLVFTQAWPVLPDSIPTHFGASGKAEAWGSKATLLLFPILGVVLYATLTLAARYPHTFNYAWPITEQNAEAQYRLARSLMVWMKAEAVWWFACIEWVITQVALGKGDGLGPGFLAVFLIVLLGTTVVYFYKSYRAR